MENPQFRIHPRQMQSIYPYKNWNVKLLTCNADIFFNKPILANKIIPNYAKFKIPTSSPDAVKAKTKHRTFVLKKK